MAENTLDHSASDEQSGEGSHHRHHSHHSAGHRHRRHHRSTHHRSASGVHSHAGTQGGERPRHRLEDQPRRVRQRSAESFFVKNFLRVAAILLLLTAFYFTLTGIPQVGDFFRSLLGPGMSDLTEHYRVPVTTIPKPPESFTFAAFLRSFFDFGKSGLLLPGLFIPVGLFLAARMKKENTGIYIFIAWILYAALWMIQTILTGNRVMLYTLWALALVVYASFFTYYLLREGSGRSKTRQWIHSVEIFLNGLTFFALAAITLHYFSFGRYLIGFTAALLLLNLSGIYLASQRGRRYDRVPHLAFLLFLLCMLVPLASGIVRPVLFLAPIPVLLLLYSKYTRHQGSILAGMGGLTLLALSFSVYWATEFIPSVFLKTRVYNDHEFFRGLIVSLLPAGVFYFAYRMLRSLEITLSKKIFNRSTTRKVIKGLLLFTLYLLFYWVWNYIFFRIFGDNSQRYPVWFFYNSFYFLFVLPYLGSHHSSFLRPLLILALIINLAYPLFINPMVIDTRNEYLLSDPGLFRFFLFHYACSGSLIVLLFVILQYMKRAFAGKKLIIRAFYFYFSVFLTGLVISEYDHLSIILGFREGGMINEIINANRKLPYSLILLGTAVVTLALGFARKSRFLRIYSLFLLSLSIAKILVYDIGSMTAAGRSLLFLFLGLLLLVISLFYSKIKHFFLREHRKNSNTMQEEGSPGAGGEV